MLLGSSPITQTSPTSKARQKSGPFPPPALPGFISRMTLSDSRRDRRSWRRRGRYPRLRRAPPITRITLPACRAHYPGGSNGCLCRLLRRSLGLPRVLSGSASALWISRPAQASLALRPAGSLDRQKRPLSRGFGPSSCPSKPLVSYQINRQLSGRNPPPLVTRAFGAHQNKAICRG